MFRRGIRWAKVSGSRGKWHVACGWRGDFQASPLQRSTTSGKRHAVIIAKGWIGDSTEQELALGRKRDAEERAEDARTRKLIGAEAFKRIPRRPRYNQTSR